MAGGTEVYRVTGCAAMLRKSLFTLYSNVNVFSAGENTNWGHFPNWNLRVLVFKEREKSKYPKKNFLDQGQELTTNSTPI